MKFLHEPGRRARRRTDQYSGNRQLYSQSTSDFHDFGRVCLDAKHQMLSKVSTLNFLGRWVAGCAINAYYCFFEGNTRLLSTFIQDKCLEEENITRSDWPAYSADLHILPFMDVVTVVMSLGSPFPYWLEAVM